MITTFYICIWIFLYSYFWYPVVIWLLGRFFYLPHESDTNYTPFVSIIVPTKNEEYTIAKKIDNCLSLDYPKDKIEILIVDSSSDDNTGDIVKKYKKHWVSLVVVPHKWKAYAMKQAIDKHAKGEIIISTDANAYFKKDVITKIVQHFHDDTVWWVSGAMVQLDESNTVESEWSGLYWQMEKFLRIQESRFHSTISMNGEITCFKKNIVKWKKWYFKWDPDDFDLSLFIIQKWYRIIYEPSAKVWETAPDTPSDIEKQKTRIIVQTLSAFTHYYKALSVRRYGFILFSHKLLALMSPIFLLGIYI